MLLTLTALLLVLNALFVLVEMALVSSKRARLQARVERGDRGTGGARAALELIDQPTRYLSTTQFGITMIGILMGAFGEAAIADRMVVHIEAYGVERRYAHYIALAATVLLLTYLSIVFAELVPKRLGQRRPEAFASIFATPMLLLSRMAAPAVWVLSVSTEMVLKLVPIKEVAEHHGAEDEVKAILETGTQAGVFHESEQELVERVFRMGDERVTAAMVPRTDIDFLRADDTTERVRVVIATSSHSHYPVCKTGLDDLVGVVHVKDLIRAGIMSETISLTELARDPVFVPESTEAISLLDRFRDSGNHIAFVIDEYGSIMGLVTMNDLLRRLIGEGTTAEASHDPSVVRRADGSYLLDGMLAVAELKELMGVSALPREEEAAFETLGGFVMTQLGRIPSTGDFFEYERFGFEIVDMDRTRVDKVLMTEVKKRAEDVEGAGEGV